MIDGKLYSLNVCWCFIMTQLFFYSLIVARTDHFHFTVLKPNLFKVQGFRIVCLNQYEWKCTAFPCEFSPLCEEEKTTFHFHSYFLLLLSYLLSYNIFLGTNSHSISAYTSYASSTTYVVLISKEPGKNLKNVYTIVC